MIVHPRRAVAVAGIAMLCVGVLYAGIATVRLYGQIFARPQDRDVSDVDAYLAPMQVRSAATLRDAVLAANWPIDANVVVVADQSLDRQTIYQTYYSTSYALYPRHVWLASSCDPVTIDAAVARHNARYVVSIGRTSVFPHARRRSVSDTFTLLELR